MDFLLNLLPLIIFLGFFIFLMRNMGARSARSQKIMTESVSLQKEQIEIERENGKTLKEILRALNDKKLG
jgi:hypothetical protein